jgi:hypothetical protein
MSVIQESGVGAFGGGINLFGEILLIIISLLPISLFTLFLKEEVFQTWWRFARWSVPVLMFFTYVLNGSGGGGFGISSSDFILVWLLYIIFFITSFAIIIRATYRAAGQ